MADIFVSSPKGEKLIHVNQSVVVGTLNSDEIANAEELSLVQVNWKTKGANSSAVLQGSHLPNPAAGDWYTIQTLVTGIGAAINVYCKRIRVQITQTTATQANEITVFGSR